jgi:tetratricopeptide (TPR) repeat protein
MNRRQFEQSERSFRKAVSLNPNDSQALALFGVYLTAIGEPEQGIEQFNQAMRINPFEPKWFRWSRGIAYFTAGRYEEAIADLSSINSPLNEARGWLAASYAHAGRLDEARAMLEEFMQIAEQEMAVFPGRKLTAWETYWHGAIEYKNEEQFQHLYDGLRKAGLAD